MAIHVPKRAYEPKVQVCVRLRPDLARQLRAYARRNEVDVQGVVETGIRAVIGKKAAA